VYDCAVLTVWGVVLCCAVQGPIPEGLGELGLRVALSVGELDKEAYQTLYDAGMETGPVLALPALYLLTSTL